MMQKSKPNHRPFVSVVILNYNGMRFVEHCLDSVLRDSYHPKEILFVDNASSDGSAELAYAYQDRITIVRNRENYGFPKGCNLGIRVARGEIIVLLNIDTEVCEGWLTELIEPLQRDPRTGMAGSKLLFPGGDRIQFAGGVMAPNGLTQHIGYGLPDGEAFNAPKEVEYLTGASLAVRRTLLDRLGRLDEGFPLYFEDLDFSIRMKQAGYAVLYQPSSVVYHFETYGTKKQSFAYYYKYHRGRIRCILKNFGLRYFLAVFLPYELGWLRRCDWRKQIKPLLAAYAGQFPKAPYFWMRGYIRRRMK
ncbi:MAG: glycosyltransferase family 2 protein [Candidatus Omnitrophica bacterium]|nr:glycosyltransferase family 2 protein [Candidatus Omnitrophota bacterium]